MKDQTPIQTAESATPTDKSPESPSAPAAYEAFTLPEGFQLSEAASKSASDLFRSMNLSQEQAQQLVDFHASQLTAIKSEAMTAYNALRDGWRGEVLKDPALATAGDLRPEVKANIAKAIDSLGPELSGQFREALNLTGVGDHPAFIRAFKSFAEKLSEGTSVTGRGPSAFGQRPNGSARPSAAQAMYPNLPG